LIKENGSDEDIPYCADYALLLRYGLHQQCEHVEGLPPPCKLELKLYLNSPLEEQTYASLLLTANYASWNQNGV
jgi:hypothetical protein